MMYKIDISHSFRHVKLVPMDYDLLGLCHEHHSTPACSSAIVMAAQFCSV